MDFQAQIARLERMLKALASQQNLVISNNDHKKVLTLGTAASLPGSSYSAPDSSYTPTFAMQLLNPNGTPMMQVGEQFDTAYSPGMVFFSASGEPLTILDDNGLTLNNGSGDPLVELNDTGLTVNNSAGHPVTVLNDAGVIINNSGGSPIVQMDPDGVQILQGSTARVELGSFSNGDYGLQVTDPSGVSMMVNPVGGVSDASTLSTTSTNYTGIGFPTMNADIGASGRALAFITSTIFVSASGSYGQLAVSANGAAPTVDGVYGSSNLGGTASAIILLTGLHTQQNNTFTLWGRSSSTSSTASFEQNWLTIWPL